MIWNWRLVSGTVEGFLQVAKWHVAVLYGFSQRLLSTYMGEHLLKTYFILAIPPTETLHSSM